MAFTTTNYYDDEMLLRAPKMVTIPLPLVNPPFFIRASLANSTNGGVLGRIDFGVSSINQALAALTVDEASRPATSPAARQIRIVHSRLDKPIYIQARSGSRVVTVYDLLAGIHAHLWSDFTGLNTLDALQQQEVVLAAQERCRRMHISNDTVKHIDMLDGATLFTGLVQDIARARAHVGSGIDGVDGFQAVTWILQTQEPHMGLGRYPRSQ